MIGERLKHEFKGNDAWILSYREECFEQIGLKPSIKIPLYNGSLECEFRRYQMFDGKLKDFRHDGGIVKTDEEKKQMAQKHRFKKEREFKQRLEETEQNEEGDIRSFTFHRHELDHNIRKDRNIRKSREDLNDHDNRKDRKDRDDRKFRRDRKDRFDRSDKNPRSGRGKGFDKKNRRFDDDKD